MLTMGGILALHASRKPADECLPCHGSHQPQPANGRASRAASAIPRWHTNAGQGAEGPGWPRAPSGRRAEVESAGQPSTASVGRRWRRARRAGSIPSSTSPTSSPACRITRRATSTTCCRYRRLVEAPDLGDVVEPLHVSLDLELVEARIRHFAGFGIGLWIVRQIVEALNGSIRVESALGSGARFIVELPRGEPLTGSPQ
jgi:hypothetical protein